MQSPTPPEVREARQRLGLTQTEAGAVIYASLRTWQDWEAGLRRMHPAFWDLFQRKTKRRVGK